MYIVYHCATRFSVDMTVLYLQYLCSGHIYANNYTQCVAFLTGAQLFYCKMNMCSIRIKDMLHIILEKINQNTG